MSDIDDINGREDESQAISPTPEKQIHESLNDRELESAMKNMENFQNQEFLQDNNEINEVLELLFYYFYFISNFLVYIINLGSRDR